MKREIDPSLFGVYLSRYDAADRADRGEIIAEMTEKFGLSRSSLYERMERIRKGDSVFSISAGHKWSLTPKRAAAIQERKRRATIVAKYKMAGHGGKSGYCLPTDKAMELAVLEGELHPDELPSMAQMNRWLDEFGLSFKDFNSQLAVRRIEAKYAGHLYMLDATPLNKYYLSLSDGVIPRNDLFHKDKHLDDILAREGLRKVWVYFGVDKYSSMYSLQAFAPDPVNPDSKNGGENAADWMTFCWYLFLPKDRSVMQGVPENIYSDKGSGLTSHMMKNFCKRLDIEVDTHKPGHSWAKGAVEGRQSAFKRSYETLLNCLQDGAITSIDQLNRFLQGYCYADCEKKGYADRFHESTLRHPIATVTQQDLVNATTRCVQRRVDAYGCVSVQWKRGEKSLRYFIARDMRGHEVNIYRNLRGDIMAQDIKSGAVYRCDPDGERVAIYGSYRLENEDPAWAEGEAERIRRECLVDAARVRQAISAKSVMPIETTNIHRFPARGERLETDSIIAPKTFDCVEDLKLYISQVTGIAWSDVPPEIDETVEKAAAAFTELGAGIPDQFAYEVIRIFRNKRITEAL